MGKQKIKEASYVNNEFKYNCEQEQTNGNKCISEIINYK